MGHVYRIWRGDWKKNERQHWHFVPTPTDYRFTMWMESSETLEKNEECVRDNYSVGESSPIVFTYGMPDWMLFPNGKTPPVTISTTQDLVILVTERTWLTEVTLLVTLGAKNVAEYQFLRCSNFSIGSTTYVVESSQDERAKATYESLVYGERIVTSERVMNEIFGEQEMLIFHRVALEMAYADRVRHCQDGRGTVHRMEIIQLEDDEEMVDDAPVAEQPQQSLGPNEGGVVQSNGQALTAISASRAPPVLWDVGLPMLNYPGLFNAQNVAETETNDAVFWNGLINEGSSSCEELGFINTEDEGPAVLTPIQTIVGVNEETMVDKSVEAVQVEEEDNSSMGSTNIICSQLRGGSPGKEPVAADIGRVSDNSNMLTQENKEAKEQKAKNANVVETASEGSDTEDGC
ncbi:hypothetical protein Bca101_068105 [Brassica carinata]